MVVQYFSKIIILVAGVLYPAYRSFKTVKTRNPREYVRWMMYWISFACFTIVEAVADILIGWWFPLYYEIKILFFLWMLLPATNGASILYRKYIHPRIIEHEEEIDEFLSQCKSNFYDSIINFSRSSLTMAIGALLQRILNSGQNIILQSNNLPLPPNSTANAHSSAVITSTDSQLPSSSTHLDSGRVYMKRSEMKENYPEGSTSHDRTDHAAMESYQRYENDEQEQQALAANEHPSSPLDDEREALLQDAIRNLDRKGSIEMEGIHGQEYQSQDSNSSRKQLDQSFNLQSEETDSSEAIAVAQTYAITTRSQARKRNAKSNVNKESQQNRYDINTISEYMPQFDTLPADLQAYWNDLVKDNAEEQI